MPTRRSRSTTRSPPCAPNRPACWRVTTWPGAAICRSATSDSEPCDVGGGSGRPPHPETEGAVVGAILETRGLRREFGALVAVDDVDLSIEEATLHSIIGPNGAGKTTLFNLISGTLAPTRGKVFYKGEDITGHPIHQTIHKGIGRSFQITNIFPNLTVLENVRLAVQATGKDSFRMLAPHLRFSDYLDRATEVLARVGLADRALQIAGTLPHGDQRKLELGMILAPDPDVLMLDEPTAGMAAEQVPQLMELIQEIQAAGGRTVVLVEHNMSVVMTVSDRITVMHQGGVLAEGTPAEISADRQVQTAYLGALYGDVVRGGGR
ncbi:MAG: ABC transporter ATP-binding protein [Actinobacteria bacterium]|nr:ABC transporter ATP-binding protein [Actinomycetota bacterium]